MPRRKYRQILLVTVRDFHAVNGVYSGRLLSGDVGVEAKPSSDNPTDVTDGVSNKNRCLEKCYEKPPSSSTFQYPFGM
ncbi:hypothetical protein GCM10023186_22510 [Hymenobacter koreensis]|uniref:Uncharacterized protein n=1 Tax=Hymenobacter koreensis TaxID=1084523 RepID=A0ABP8IZR7_9BACT